MAEVQPAVLGVRERVAVAVLGLVLRETGTFLEKAFVGSGDVFRHLLERLCVHFGQPGEFGPEFAYIGVELELLHEAVLAFVHLLFVVQQPVVQEPARTT